MVGLLCPISFLTLSWDSRISIESAATLLFTGARYTLYISHGRSARNSVGSSVTAAYTARILHIGWSKVFCLGGLSAHSPEPVSYFPSRRSDFRMESASDPLISHIRVGRSANLMCKNRLSDFSPRIPRCCMRIKLREMHVHSCLASPTIL